VLSSAGLTIAKDCSKTPPNELGFLYDALPSIAKYEHAFAKVNGNKK
jgi:hypothetical protein